jgi:hypothetical protein
LAETGELLLRARDRPNHCNLLRNASFRQQNQQLKKARFILGILKHFSFMAVVNKAHADTADSIRFFEAEGC